MDNSNISELKVNDLRELIRTEVEQTVLELLGDPDEGLELREEIKSRLERSLVNKQAAKNNISAQKVADKLGLEW
jgi:hypothetical protein